jgi:3-deoxy-manno-octulosonate cytidylyltransferase (CMP-KDO synthetase)
MNIAFIPARLNSSRLPNKPLLILQSMSLLSHTYERTILCKSIDKVFICSGDELIKKEALKKKYNFILTKGKFRNGTERIVYAYSKIKKKIKNINLILDIQCDNVFLDFKDLNKIIKFHQKNKSHDIVIPHSITSEKENRNFVKIVSNNDNKILSLSRADIPYNYYAKKYNLKKHLDFISFTEKGLFKYSKLKKKSTLEKIENIELLRAVENEINVGTYGPLKNILSINTKEDFKNAKKIMIKDKIIKYYEKKI